MLGVALLLTACALGRIEPCFGQEPSPGAMQAGVEATPGNTPAEKQKYLVRTAWENTYSNPERIGELLIIRNFLESYELMKNSRAKPYPELRQGSGTLVIGDAPPPAVNGLLISGSYDYYQKHPRELQEILTAQLDAYRKKVQSITTGQYFIDDPDKRYKLLELVTQVVDLKYLSPGLVQEILNEELAPWQHLQFDADARKQMGSLARKVAYIQKLALADEFARSLVDPTVGRASGVATKDSTETILKNRRDILNNQLAELALLRAKAADERSKKMLDRTEQIYLLQKEILARLEKGEKVTVTELNAFNRKLVAIQREIARLSMPTTAASAVDPAVHEARTRALLSAVELLTTLIGTHDVRGARTFNAVATAAAQLYEVLSRYEEDDKAVRESAISMVSLNVFTILTTMTVAIIKSNSSEPSIEQLIYEQIIELRKEVKELGDQMHDRFDAVDKSLNLIYSEMVKALYAITQNQRVMQKSLDNVAASLGTLHDKLSEHEWRLRDYLEALADRERAAKITAGLRHSDHYTSSLTDADFENCTALLHAFALHDAGDALASGTLPMGDSLDAELLIRGLRGGPERELRFLSVLAERYGICGMADGDNADTPRPLNPQLWADCAQKYVRMGMLYPDKFKRLMKRDTKTRRYNQLAEIIAAGNQAQNSFYRITTERNLDEKASLRPNVEPMRQLFLEYADALRELTVAAEARRDELRRQLSIGNMPYKLAGRDPLLGFHQPEPEPEKSGRPKFKVANIPLCDALKEVVPTDSANRDTYGGFSRLALDPPQGIESLIPVEFLHAHEMGLGTIKIGIAYAGSTVRLPSFDFVDPDKNDRLFYRNIGITGDWYQFTIQAEFFQDNQLKGAIFKRMLRMDVTKLGKDYRPGDAADQARYYWTQSGRDKFIKQSKKAYYTENHVIAAPAVGGRPDPLNGRPDLVGTRMRKSGKMLVDMWKRVEESNKKNEAFRLQCSNLARWEKQINDQLEVPYYDVGEVRRRLREALILAQAELSKKLSADLDTDSLGLKKYADKLTAARMRLEAFMTLGWNNSMRLDRVLLGLFESHHGLPMKDQMMEAYQQLKLPRENESVALLRDDLLEPSLNSRPRSLDISALEKRVQAVGEWDALLAKDSSQPPDLAAITKLIPESTALGEEWKKDFPKAKEKLKALVRLELARALQNRDTAARLRYLATLVKDLLDDPKAMADTRMTKEQFSSLKQDLSRGCLSPANELRLKLLVLYRKLFRELLARGDGHEDYPALARTLFLLRLFENTMSSGSAP
jgi:hypothetical protein